MIKRIFADMDGTLLTPEGIVSDATAQAIKASHIPVTLVSARAPLEMKDAIDKLGLNTPQIGFNGGLIYERTGNDWKTISARLITTITAREILNAVKSNFPHVSLSYYDKYRWYADNIDHGIQYEQKLTGQSPTILPIEEVFSQPNLEVFKIMMITFDSEEMQRLKAYFNQANYQGISVAQAGTAYLEITNIDAKKSRGINYILEQERLSKNETAAFGDGYNDLPMLNMVGLPVVMGSAQEDIKKVAKFVTKSNVEDGVAYALQTLPEFKG